MPTTLLRGITGASRRTSESLCCSSVSFTPTYNGSPASATTIASSAGMPSSSTSPVTTPYWGSSPVVNLAMRTEPSLPAGQLSSGDYPRACGQRADERTSGARQGDVGVAPDRPRAPRRCPGRAAPGEAETASVAPSRGLPVHLLLATAAAHLVAQAAHRHRRPARAARLFRVARVGDGLPARADRGASLRVAAPARGFRHGRGRRVGTDRVLALRRAPALHRRRTSAEHPATGAGRPALVRAAGLPPCRDGPVQARVPALTTRLLGSGRRLLRPGPRHPRARHARVAVRPVLAGLRARTDRDTCGEAGVRRRATVVRREGRAPAAAHHR